MGSRGENEDRESERSEPDGGEAAPDSPEETRTLPAPDAASRRNRTVIALVIVSILAAMLLASTITLALVGDFSGKGGREAWKGWPRPPALRKPPDEYFKWRREWRPPRGRWWEREEEDGLKGDQGNQEDKEGSPDKRTDGT